MGSELTKRGWLTSGNDAVTASLGPAPAEEVRARNVVNVAAACPRLPLANADRAGRPFNPPQSRVLQMAAREDVPLQHHQPGHL